MNERDRVRILVSAGAFKQSLTAAEVCAAIARGLEESGLDATVEQLPIADGGNGTLDAFLATGGERITVPVMDPLLRPIQADYGLIDEGRTAVIEMALASGLELLQPAELNPLAATTYGTGQQMAAALGRGVQRIIIGLGGSATVDGGMGCLSALGLRLLDENGQAIPVGGAGLETLAAIDAGGMDERWRDVEIADTSTPVESLNGTSGDLS